MNKTTEWFLKMKDNVLPQMERIAKAYNVSFAQNQRLQKQLDENSNKSKQFASNVDTLNKRLDELTKKRSISINMTDIEKLNREIRDTEKQISKITTAGLGRGHWSSFKDSLGNLPFIGQLRNFATNPYGLAATALIAGSQFAYSSSKTNLGFDRQFAKINATAQLSGPAFNELRRDILREGRGSVVDIHTVPDAFEKILSATNNVRLSKDILKYSLLGSRAGFADVNEVASSTVGILNSVGTRQTNAQKVLDVLFASKRLGVGEFKDFSQYLPSVITQGVGLGYKYQDVAGAFSYLTTRGFKADYTNTLLSNVFTSLGRPEVLKDLRKYGVNPYNKSGERIGLYDIFNQLQQKLDGRSQKQQDLILGDIVKDAQAKLGFNALMKDTDALGKIMRETTNSAGEMKRALDATENGLNDVQKLSNEWIVLKDSLGKTFSPALISLVRTANQILERHNAENDMQSLSLAEQKSHATQAMLNNLRKTGRMGYDGDLIRIMTAMGDNGFSSSGSGVAMYEGRLAAYAKITNAQIKANPNLYGLKYYGIPGTPRSLFPDAFGGNNPTSGNTKPADPMLNNILDGISGGGNIKNFNVHIGTMKAADKIELHDQDAKEVYDEIEDKMLERLVRVIQGVELTAGGAN